jgi:hypothetical protein
VSVFYPRLSKRPSSADRLRRLLAATGDPLRLYTTETLYRVQVDYTCQLLDVVDEVADEVTASLIMSAIYERLISDGVSEAAKRIRETRAEMERLMSVPPSAAVTGRGRQYPDGPLEAPPGGIRPRLQREQPGHGSFPGDYWPETAP